jgi:hypothetical protein
MQRALQVLKEAEILERSTQLSDIRSRDLGRILSLGLFIERLD